MKQKFRKGAVVGETVTTIIAFIVSTLQPYLSPALGALVRYIWVIDNDDEKDFSVKDLSKCVIVGSLVGDAVVEILMAYDIGKGYIGALGFFSGMLSFLLVKKLVDGSLFDSLIDGFIKRWTK